MTLAERYRSVKSEVEQSCYDAGRDPDEVRIIAVSKTVDAQIVRQALNIGMQDFGENRPDDLADKKAVCDISQSESPRWHFIGNIQSRKIPLIVQNADLIHSVYKSSHLPLIDKEAAKLFKTQKLLVEVNMSGEDRKGGLQASELVPFIEESLSYRNIQICGLMTMAPQGDSQLAQTCFEGLSNLLKETQNYFTDDSRLGEMHELSMGMSEDWREAIRAGATMIRIGRAIFDDTFAGL